MWIRKQLNSWENFYIHIYQQGLLIEEQNIPDLNPLFTIVLVQQQHGTGVQTS
jgi:hypothetical protein